ncbi:MAG: hypothetical protein D6815_05500 [Candidatus Dadabacteria bacterium]|nr:MAG: hypothetical protein D6815_05500 [Candidatus Dadabacteria bacterium]
MVALVLFALFARGTHAASAQSANATVILGPEETLFDWTTDRCEDYDVPDAPARAFRDTARLIHLVATHWTGRQMLGGTLDTLTHECSVIMDSHLDADPSMFNDKEWLHSFYTPDGQTVFALVHNEYQGHTHPGQCPSGQYQQCWYNSVTFAKSEDEGMTFSHSLAPSHLVASVPYQYEPDQGPFGIFNPSNIVFNEADGYYYALLHLEQYGLQDWGTCVMRTQTIEDPSSWRAWDGTGFNVQFIDPYLNPGVDPALHVCAPVSRNNIQKMHESLTFNTHFHQYLLVGVAGKYDPNLGKTVWGFYYSLSSDLVEWTDAQLIMEARLPWTSEPPGDFLVYPSILDPRDTTRNFETSGKTAYLFYTRWHSGLDRDLVRRPIEFAPSLISGRKLVIKDHASDPTRRRARFISKDSAMTDIALPGEPGDPTCSGPGGGGGLLRLIGTGGSGQDTGNIALPCENWKPIGPASAPKGYRYRDKEQDQGPCKFVLIRAGKLVRASCSGKNPASPLPYDLTAAGEGSVAVMLQTGASFTYCAEFPGSSGTVFRDNERLFSARNAPAPAGCALGVLE